MTDTTTTWGEVQGRDRSPSRWRWRSCAPPPSSTPCPPPRPPRCCPGDAFEVVEVAPGTAQLVIAAVDYVRNPWGDYDELNLGFLARPAGAPAEVIGSFVYRMPVNQAFTCEAGNRVMGFPKTVEDLTVTYTDAPPRSGWPWAASTCSPSPCPAPRRSGEPSRVEATSYSYLDGVPYGTDLSMDMGTGMVDPADVQLELGDSPVADELRSLGLPARPTSPPGARASAPRSSSAGPSDWPPARLGARSSLGAEALLHQAAHERRGGVRTGGDRVGHRRHRDADVAGRRQPGDAGLDVASTSMASAAMGGAIVVAPGRRRAPSAGAA